MVEVSIELLICYPSFVLGSIGDNPDEFKLNVHNIFTVRLSRPVAVLSTFTYYLSSSGL